MGPVFEIDRSRVDGHARVRFVGELDLDQAKRAQIEVVEVLDRTAGTLTIDLSDLTFCDSSGIGLLLTLRSEAAARGRAMVLQRLRPTVERVLRLTGVYDSFTIEDGA